MPDPVDHLAQLRQLNSTGAFNRWAGFEVAEAEEGRVVLRLPWKEELGQYNGYLHTSLISGLIATVCGFAAMTLVGDAVATQCGLFYLRPSRGRSFIATAQVIKSGRRQAFANAELHAIDDDGSSVLIATGQAVMVPIGPQAA